MISGATYSGVPQNVHVFFPKPIFFAKPKSTYKKVKEKFYSSFYFQHLIHAVYTSESNIGVYQFGVAPVVQYKVFWFEVSVNNAFGMQISESFHYTCCVKSCSRIFKGTSGIKKRNKSKNEIQSEFYIRIWSKCRNKQLRI